MATFSYVAIDKSGKEVKGNVEADNIESARQETKRKELNVAILLYPPDSAIYSE